jgi:hypothetical protein
MEDFARYTRSRKNGLPGPQQPQNTAELPTVVRKLQSMLGFVHKARPSRKVVLRESPSPKKVAKNVVEVVEEKKPLVDDHFKFIGKTAALRELVSEAAICRNCKKGALEVSFVNRGLVTEIQTKRSTCNQWLVFLGRSQSKNYKEWNKEC